MDNISAIVFVCIAVGIVVWLLAREVICWYWKINYTIASLENIESLLESIDDRLARPSTGKSTFVQTEEIES